MEAPFPDDERPELADLRRRVEAPDCRVLLLGGPGSGKTTLLRQLMAELEQRGQAVFLVGMRQAPARGLTAWVTGTIMQTSMETSSLFADVAHTVRTSGGGSAQENVAVLNRMGERLPEPVLLVDDVGGQAAAPGARATAAVEELGQGLRGWRLVVASRPDPAADVRRLLLFDVVRLQDPAAPAPPPAGAETATPPPSGPAGDAAGPTAAPPPQPPQSGSRPRPVPPQPACGYPQESGSAARAAPPRPDGSPPPGSAPSASPGSAPPPPAPPVSAPPAPAPPAPAIAPADPSYADSDCLQPFADPAGRHGSASAVPTEDIWTALGDPWGSATPSSLTTSPHGTPLLDQFPLAGILEELLLAGGRDRVTTLARRLRLPEDLVRLELDGPPARRVLTVDRRTDTVEFTDAHARDTVLYGRLYTRRFQPAELRFGAEAAERDDLLYESFVERHNLERVLGQRRSLVIGDRGAGKSAVFRGLTESPWVETLPLTNPGDLLHRIITDDDTWLDADAVRAAWLTVVAAVVAAALPQVTPEDVRRRAQQLRSALGLPVEPVGRARRALNACLGFLRGTPLKFGVGPVTFETALPAGTAAGDARLDVASLLQEMDRLLAGAGHRVVVLLDRVDELFKYDRVRQEKIVQALIQAESETLLLTGVGLIVFLRTDLFELYDIQEKNKLVSRTLTLDWPEEDWLRLLVRRAFANAPLSGLARRFLVAEEDIQVRAALEVLFPAEIEGRPVDRWLLDSLRNGNGAVSPRSAVLLLYLARDQAALEDAPATVPLFSADAVQRAMTRLSDLAFSEVVNDFKIASTFVLNCRAGKLVSFTRADVEQLFDESEGGIADQIRLLERLGFLERVVEQRGTGAPVSKFRIPPLYTRCWDYA